MNKRVTSSPFKKIWYCGLTNLMGYNNENSLRTAARRIESEPYPLGWRTYECRLPQIAANHYLKDYIKSITALEVSKLFGTPRFELYVIVRQFRDGDHFGYLKLFKGQTDIIIEVKAKNIMTPVEMKEPGE